MTARRYTQGQVQRIFTQAEKSAIEKATSPEHRAAFMLGYVAASLGVTLGKSAVTS